ncbi:PREDICTED: PRUPE_7G026800 [Prunus dulcis]|uniref:PREDICTED: PRUPE_7G026800 n=1 Tax=Prunus dulcis TaxID=3755 RepID=A0A5E4G0S6_PRUDU|nr:PREDICTED: PRUPE_7G026800 [Prunus dulcis]
MFEKASTNIPLKFVDVAAGKDVSEDGCADVVEQTKVEANKLLHNVPLGEGSIRVFVYCAINAASPLPIPVKRVLKTVEDAVESQVAWLEDLIVFKDDIVFADSMIMDNSYLYKLVEDQEWEQMIAFMDPSRTARDPMSPDEAGRVQYIVKSLNQASIDSIFLIPYNPGGYGIFTIIDEERDNVYIMDPLGVLHPHNVWKPIGAPRQADGKTCGYCVMRYMKLVKIHPLHFELSMREVGKRRDFTPNAIG